MYVFGAVAHAAALAEAGRMLGYHVTVSDARARFVTSERIPQADQLVVGWPDEVLRDAPVDERTAICVLTHDRKLDVPALKARSGLARRLHRRDGEQAYDRSPRGSPPRGRTRRR